MPASKILIVDDQEDNVLLIQMVLEKEGFEVATAFNGAQALDQLKSETPDLMLLDVMMPEKSGFDVLETIRDSQEPCMKIPIIMLTVLHQTSKIQQAFEMGATAYVSKPYDFPELLKKIRSLLKTSAEGPGAS